MWDIKPKATNEQTRQTDRRIDTDDSVVVTRGKVGGKMAKGKEGQLFGDRGDLTSGGEHTAQHTDAVL